VCGGEVSIFGLESGGAGSASAESQYVDSDEYERKFALEHIFYKAGLLHSSSSVVKF
jgi:hypothetical protein